MIWPFGRAKRRAARAAAYAAWEAANRKRDAEEREAIGKLFVVITLKSGQVIQTQGMSFRQCGDSMQTDRRFDDEERLIVTIPHSNILYWCATLQRAATPKTCIHDVPRASGAITL